MCVDRHGFPGLTRASGCPDLLRPAFRRLFLAITLSLSLSSFFPHPVAKAYAQDLPQWKQVPSNGPPARYSGAMAFDTARGNIVLFGGHAGYGGGFFSDTWVWDGSTWKQVATTGPSERGWAGIAYDEARSRMVLFGGVDCDAGTCSLGDTWEWDGSVWQQVATIGPSARDSPAMVYDIARGKSVLFGGINDYPPYSDTWEWDGSVWKQMATIGPAARYLAMMAYDRVRDRTVLYGGYDAHGHFFSDTWEWNGINWKLVATSGPPARDYASMTFDSARGRTVLFGGRHCEVEPCGAYSDTWEWDGSEWRIVPSVVGPSPRIGAAMAYDGTNGRTLLYGGTYPGWFATSDTWEYGTFHVSTVQDAITALKISAGMLTAGQSDLNSLDVEKTGPSAGRVDIADAIRIARKAAGLDPNP